MATEYTTLYCPLCGSTYPAKQFHTCVAFKEAVREIAEEQVVLCVSRINSEAMKSEEERMRLVAERTWNSMWAQVSDDDFFVKPEESQVAAIARRVAREEIAKAYGGALETVKKCARDDALEDAARIAHSWNPSHYHKAAQEIRSLKSQPAAPTFRGVPIPPHPQREEIIKPAAQASAPLAGVDPGTPWGRVVEAKQASAEKPLWNDTKSYAKIDEAQRDKWAEEMLRRPEQIAHRSGDSIVRRQGGEILDLLIRRTRPCERVVRAWEEEGQDEIASLRKERDGYRTDYIHFEEMYKSAIAEKNAVQKERDDLRAGRAADDREYAALHEKLDQCSRASQVLDAKLAEAEKVIKDAYDAVPYGWLDKDGYKFVKEMLRILSGHPATIRLTPRKQEEQKP